MSKSNSMYPRRNVVSRKNEQHKKKNNTMLTNGFHHSPPQHCFFIYCMPLQVIVYMYYTQKPT